VAVTPRYLAIGRILGAHGIRGEVKVELHTDHPERFSRLSRVHMGVGGDPQPVAVLGSRLHGNRALVRLEGCPDRTAAQRLRGRWLYIPVEEAVPLEEDEYYEFQALGSQVETVQGEVLGRIRDVIFTAANEVFVVHGAQGEILIPVLKDVVLEIDGPGARVVVSLPPGLRPAS
jgi:16S rRNA processing protein RimM